MKKLKLNMLMIAALVIGAATMSFKMAGNSINNESQDGVEVWMYTGSTTAGQDTPSNYILADESDACNGLSAVRCTLHAPEDGNGEPVLSQATQITFKP